MSVQDLESAVLNLPSHERARLAELLISSGRARGWTAAPR